MGLLDKLFSKKPHREEFAKIVLTALQKRGAGELHYEPSNYSIRLGSSDLTLFLDNAYSDYCASKRDERESCLQKYLAALLETSSEPTDYDSAKARLMPVVRDPAYYGLSQLMLKAQGRDTKNIEYPTKAITEGLLSGVARDTEQTIMNVTQANLQAWSLTFLQALEHAIENLRDRTDPRALKQIAPGIYLGEWGDSYDSSRVLLPDLFHRIQLDGDPVIFVPNRNHLLVAGRYDTAALGIILNHGGESHFNQGHPLSPNLYVHHDGQWQPFVPEDESLRRQWINIRRRRDAMDYEQQKGYLEKIYSKEGRDIFLADCQLLKRTDESLFTRCVWGNGVDTSLPKTDTVVFGIDLSKKDFLSVTWESALPVIASLLEPEPQLEPVRYRARTFPGENLISQLRSFAQ